MSEERTIVLPSYFISSMGSQAVKEAWHRRCEGRSPTEDRRRTARGQDEEEPTLKQVFDVVVVGCDWTSLGRTMCARRIVKGCSRALVESLFPCNLLLFELRRKLLS